MSPPDGILDDLFLGAGLTVLRATLVLLGAIGLSRLLRDGSASARHALWTGAMASLLLVPFLPQVVPTIPLPVLPGGAELARLADPASHSTAGGAGADAVGPIDALRPGGLRNASGGTAPDGTAPDASTVDERTVAPGTSDRSGIRPLPGGAAMPVEPASSGVGAAAPPSVRAGGPLGGPLQRGLLLLWGTGFLALGAALALGLFRGRGLIRSARGLSDPDWEPARRRLEGCVGLTRRVPLLLTPGIPTPMAGGLARPVVLLPENALGWSADRRDAVLLHEYVHVKRRDPARQLLGRLVLALYWFHPLAWYAVREGSRAREEACDERVVELGARPSSYARHLLALSPVAPAHRRTPADPADLGLLPGFSGFHHPDFEERIMAILTPRRPARRRLSTTVLVGGTLWVGALTALDPVEREAPAERPASEAAAGLLGDTLPPPPPVAPGPVAPEPLQAPGVPVLPQAAWGGPAATAAPPAPPPIPAEEAPARAPVLPAPPTVPSPPVSPCGDPIPTEHRLDTSEGWTGSVRSSHIRLDGDGAPLSLCFWSLGPIEFSPDGAEIRSMAPGDRIVLRLTGPEGTQRLEIEGTSGPPTYRWMIGDEERPFDAEGEAWLAAALELVAARHDIARLRGAEARLRGEIARTVGEEARLHGQLARIEGEGARLQGERARAAAAEGRLAGEVARLQGEEARILGALARLRAAQDRDTTVERAEVEARLAEHRRAMEEALPALRAEMDRLDVPAALAALDEGIEAHLAEAGARIAEVERALAEIDTEARVREVEARLAELGAAERIDALEARMEPASRALRELAERVGW